MKTNLIQSFIHNQNTPPSKKEAPEFDIHRELANKTFIRPLKGQGRLVKSNIFDAPAVMVKDLAYDVNSLKSGVNGNANDHQLGKLNDIGMKLGGLGIAAYLFTKRQTPLTKTMEFVGLGSFFASMALWPKLAIQLPARAIHGFNVQQQYEDSFGRKKPFYQDPQFLPWDLYSADEINKIGDRMGVPKNIPNRRDFIQEKMKKIAIQNNTLWMLTAGFATPIMSALICNQLEKPLSGPLSSARNKNNNDILNNFNNYVESNKSNKINKNIQNFISINQNKPLSEALIEDLSRIITEGFEPQVTDAMKKDLLNILEAKNFVINNNSINEIARGSEKRLKELGFDEKVIKQILPTPEQLTKYFDEEKGYFGNDYTPDEIENIFNEYTMKIRSKIKEYNENNKENPAEIISERRQNVIINNLLLDSKENNPIYKGLTKETHAVLDTANQKMITEIGQAMNSLDANFNALDKYIYRQLGEGPETSVADYWNKTVDTFLEGLKIPQKQIAQIKNDNKLATEAIRNSYDTIASDKKAYGDFMNKLIAQIAQLSKMIKQTDVNENMFNSKEMPKFDKLVNSTTSAFEAAIKKLPNFAEGDMEYVLDEILGGRKDINSPRTEWGSVKEMYKNIAKNRIVSIKSSFFRIINALDVHRRLATGDKTLTPALHSGMPREVKEEVAEISKLLGISGHSADFFTKFFSLRNPHPDYENTTDLEIKNGRLVYRFLNPNRTKGKAAMPQDVTLFVESMKLQYQNPLSPETEAAFGKNKELLAEFKKYRELVCNEVGNIDFIENFLNKVAPDGKTKVSDRKIYQLIGAPTEELVGNYSKQAFNTNKWLKMFGTMGAVLLGVTVASQFFFGRMKTPAPITENQKGQLNA